MAEEEAKPMTYISETILKKRKVSEEMALRRKLQMEQRVFANKKNKIESIKRPEDFIREFRYREADLLCMKTRMKKKRPEFDSSRSPLLLVIRINGTNDMHPASRKILYSLRLRKVYNAVFVRANASVLEKLRRIEPFVTYGSPSLKSVKDLIYKKGFASIAHQRVPLTDNVMIEKELGKYGVLCLEDIVHEIVNVGPHFKEITRFLWPLMLNKPTGGVTWSKKLFKDGGDTGDRKDRINEIIDKMN